MPVFFFMHFVRRKLLQSHLNNFREENRGWARNWETDPFWRNGIVCSFHLFLQHCGKRLLVRKARICFVNFMEFFLHTAFSLQHRLYAFGREGLDPWTPAPVLCPARYGNSGLMNYLGKEYCHWLLIFLIPLERWVSCRERKEGRKLTSAEIFLTLACWRRMGEGICD